MNEDGHRGVEDAVLTAGQETLNRQENNLIKVRFFTD